MGKNYALDSTRHRRLKSARQSAGGDPSQRRVEAELQTTQALEGLDPDMWTVVTDLQWPGGRYGNVDHVVVGPSGIYVIDTKTWSGDVSAYGDRLRYEGTTQDSVVASLNEAAGAVALLTPGVPQRLVKPVLCASGAEGLEARVGALLVCSPDNLVSMLEARVHSMSTHQITTASGQLVEHLHNRGLVRVAARAGHREAKNANRRHFGQMRSVPVLRIAFAVWLAATLVLAPQVFPDTLEAIQETVEEQLAKR